MPMTSICRHTRVRPINWTHPGVPFQADLVEMYAATPAVSLAVQCFTAGDEVASTPGHDQEKRHQGDDLSRRTGGVRQKIITIAERFITEPVPHGAIGCP
ncbi:hypothetical protein ACSDR0_50310 [Streptosporangium sp. G11]|uniref:hypothetical protein n=1 Tax=Streptosporangium sp. G11 TaxID=3436926 RepID=UPI003EB705AD